MQPNLGFTDLAIQSCRCDAAAHGNEHRAPTWGQRMHHPRRRRCTVKVSRVLPGDGQRTKFPNAIQRLQHKDRPVLARESRKKKEKGKKIICFCDLATLGCRREVAPQRRPRRGRIHHPATTSLHHRGGSCSAWGWAANQIRECNTKDRPGDRKKKRQ